MTAPDLHDGRVLRDLLTAHGFRFSKSMGQNFLLDRDALERIADAAGLGPTAGVMEIGPGAGALTAELARRAGKVVSIELDRGLLPVLAETLGDFSNVEIVQGDALKLDLNALAAEKLPGLTPVVCANLPYNITTAALEKLVQTPCLPRFTVLVQKEVAQRLAAAPGSRTGGAFSLYLHYYMEPELLFSVPRDLFLPAPKVDSAVLRCVRRERPAVEVEDEAWFFRVVRGGFLLRRKTLANSLSAALPELSREAVRSALGDCGLGLSVRGEALTLEDWAALSGALAAAREN